MAILNGPIQEIYLLRVQAPIRGGAILEDVLFGVSFGNNYNPLFAQAPVKSYLRRRLASLPRKLLKNAARVAILEAVQAPRQRTIGYHGYMISLAILQEALFDGSIDQVVSDLI